MARSADSPAIPWAIADNDVLQTTVIGNNSNRFDAWSQVETLGPQPDAPGAGSPETGGDTTHEGK